MSAIVAALAVATSAALTGCGQRGPLYLPTVPPLPEKPELQTVPPASGASAGAPAESAASGTAARTPLALAPADSLGATPNDKQAAPAPASSPASDQ
jgi:predicted small lipoprotein YifL